MVAIIWMGDRMTAVDLTVVSKTVWHKLSAMKMATWENGIDLQLLQRLLLNYLDNVDCFEPIIDVSQNLYQQLCWVYMYQSMTFSERPCNDILWFAGIDLGFKGFLSNYIEFTTSRLWLTLIPASYRYTADCFYNRFFFGAHLLQAWSRNHQFLCYYYAYYMLLTMPLENTPELWLRYIRLHRDLIAYLQSLQSQTWFWQFGLRSLLLKAIDQLNQDIIALNLKLKERFNIDKCCVQIGDMLLQEGFYPELFQFVFSAEEVDALKVGWEMYAPECLVVYKGLTSDILSPEEYELWCSRYLIFDERMILSGGRQGYLYAHIIHRLLNSEPIDGSTLAALFEKTISKSFGFWYQFQVIAKRYSNETHETWVHKKIMSWQYVPGSIFLNSHEPIVLAKVPIKDYPGFVMSFQRSHNRQSMRENCKQLADLSFQISTGLTFQALKSAWVIWQSLDCVMRTPVYNLESFHKKLLFWLDSHECLPIQVKYQLQAYMAVLAKYIWYQRWDRKRVSDVSGQFSKCPHIAWRIGMQDMKQLADTPTFHHQYLSGDNSL